MIITPELIEKAARAIHRQATKDGCDFGNWSNTKPEYLAQGRAALTAILPDIVEAIAKVAKDMVWARHSDEEVAEAIRQLGREET